MPILNYTTRIDAEKTIGEIQKKLAAAGAEAVLTEYDPDGVVKAVSFRMEYHGQLVSFRLPARTDPIYVILQNDPNVRRQHRTREQACRVAWRIVKDWIEAQLALVEAEQAEMVEVFLPYAQNPMTGETLFKQIAESKFKLLEQHG